MLRPMEMSALKTLSVGAFAFVTLTYSAATAEDTHPENSNTTAPFNMIYGVGDESGPIEITAIGKDMDVDLPW